MKKYLVHTTRCFVMAVSVLSCVQGAQAGVDMLTSRNNDARTGANLSETVLTPASVTPARFGKLFSYGVEGNIYAQPLVVTNVETVNGLRNVVYVATTDNVVYAFNAESSAGPTGGLIWKRVFANVIPFSISYQGIPIYGLGQPATGPVVMPIPYDDPTHYHSGNNPIYSGGTLLGKVGIVSTPVISLPRKTLYVVVRTKEGNDYVQRLHALDITNGNERRGSPVTIARNPSPLSFAALQNQRAGLALAQNRVIVAWGSPGGKEGSIIKINEQDEQGATWHGYVMAFDANTLRKVGCFTTANQKNSGAGFWQSGRAPVIDANGFVYYFTGNGFWEQPPQNTVIQCAPPFPERRLNNSLIKLNPSMNLRLEESVAVFDEGWLDRCDLDLGGSGPLLIPGTSLLVGGGKEGFLHVFDSEQNGTYREVQRIQLYEGPKEDYSDPGVCYNDHGLHHVMGGPVFWESASKGPLIYISTENGPLQAYALSKPTRRINETPVLKTSRTIIGHPGAILSLSANETNAGTGIVWAVHGDRAHRTEPNQFTAKIDGVLRAYDAEDLSRELWNSNMSARDALGAFAKFTPPTIANGKVYMATFSGQLVVYGLLP